MYGTLSIFNISLSAVRLVCIYVLNCFYNINFMDVVYVFVVSEIIYFIILNLYSSYLSGGYIVLFRFDFNMIKNGFEINLTTIFDLPVSTLDTYVVNYFFGTESVGVYKLIRKYVSVLGRVISPLNQVLFPEIINIAQDQKRKFLLKCILATFFLSLVLGFSISYSIFKLDLDFFSNIREANLDKIEIYFLSIMGVEVIALTFSILNYLLVSYGKNIVNGKAVFLANLVFFMTLLILSYLTKDIIIATSVSLFLQVLFLIIYRIKVIFKCGI
ncbi:hypothetical protein LZI70_05910 [Vibrio pelagius]|uniref:Polysaccharide biosynthesis protein C-terminal domain-containing protein n=1 Tax=Vibrio pelagius TaxID=28169 RepID=A0ABY5G6G7_VIBPE|nr:hypothetical protein [Vibrio pelagius]UTT85776.1 hypothetical protein LZI70_05910 [Vibrio pelagius]